MTESLEDSGKVEPENSLYINIIYSCIPPVTSFTDSYFEGSYRKEL